MIALPDLAPCFEGVIPSIIATTAADGTPNISYLSHVVMVDGEHVALSNQFFSKTAANIRENPRATLLLVDPGDGAQFRLDIRFVASHDSGEVFEQARTDLNASSAQIGMADVMRLKCVDIYRVTTIAAIPSPVVPSVVPTVAPSARPEWTPLERASRVVEAITEQSHLDGIVDAVLDGLYQQLDFVSGMLLHLDEQRQVLTTLGSRGYAATGVGAEVVLGEGIIGSAARERRLIKVSDMSRIRRLGAAIRNSSANEERTRTIALPGMPDAMSQIGVPMIAQGQLYGVLFAESPQRLAFSREDEKALAIIARQAAAALLLAEALASEPSPVSGTAACSSVEGKPFRVIHYAFDDSVFIDNTYVIKGVPGRLLIFMLTTLQRERRNAFTNRELRLSETLRLPDVKDNLETRLLLLRRRLVEKGAPVQLVRTGRGCVELQVNGSLQLEQA